MPDAQQPARHPARRIQSDPLLPPVPSREELREHLIATGIAGEVRTGRAENLRNFGRCLDRWPNYTFGLTLSEPRELADVIAEMAKRAGIRPELDYLDGVDTIDPELTIDRLDELGERLARAARNRERVLIATGHPTGIAAIHIPVAMALAAAGCQVLTVAEGWSYEDNGHREVRYIGGVAMISDGAGMLHTHAEHPMRAILAELDRLGQAPPELVVADHGWAGAAGEAGLDVAGFADCNDPALFLGEADGKIATVVPLDDNVRPLGYRPVTAYLLRGLAG